LNIIDEEYARVHAFLVNLQDARFIEPLNALACFPKPKLYAVFCTISIRPKTVLLSLVPPTLVLATVGPVVDTEAFFFVIFILTIVSHTVLIKVYAESVHVVLPPLSVVLTSIMP
jgi:hypothetical protein